MPVHNRTDHEHALAALGICISARIPVLLWGNPGEGKTATVESAKDQGWHVETVIITHSKEPDKPVEVTLAKGLDANQANVEIQPGDTINVSRAGMVYVIGEVTRPGEFVMETTQTPSLLQILAAAAGPTRMADLSHARVIRRTPKGLESKDVDLRKIMQAKAGDLEVQADDIVYVPSSRTKGALERGSGSIFSMLTNLAIYRF